jgi:hypothetical protein
MTQKPTSDTKTATPAADIMESVIAKGDLAKLTPAERTEYYLQTCRSMGLNPLTQPFSYIVLNNKLTLYANRACADQLRKVNGVSLEVVSEKVVDDILTVHVRAKLPDGRFDEDWGSVPFPSTLKGDFRANMKLKAITKAKRRATLSICGLGWLDELEIEDIPAGSKRTAKPEALPKPSFDDAIPDFDAEDTAGDTPTADEPAAPDKAASTPADQGAAGTSFKLEARATAKEGVEPLRALWRKSSPEQQAWLKTNMTELEALYPK